jgi:hypothetical protein
MAKLPQSKTNVSKALVAHPVMLATWEAEIRRITV